MKSIVIHTQDSTYPVIVGEDAINELLGILKNLEPSKVLVVTDTNVDRLYSDFLIDKIKPTYTISKYVINSGEEAKSFDVFYDVQTFALKQQLDRKSVVIAFGGGVVGDLTGFVAATYMRGIPYIQVPTTLLAHDSAVGGKVAINHPEGKNMIGAFYQPKAVVYDSKFLKSLPVTELRSGFAEVIKHSLIKSESFYEFLVKEIQQLEDITTERLQRMILEGIQIKADVVTKDERELGLREILNFGHTLGHAVEAEAGYGKLSHGDCVAVGMLFATWLSNKLLQADLPYRELKTWFATIGFPVEVPDSYTTEQLIAKMVKDKKTKSNQIKMILLERIGETTSATFSKEELQCLLNEWREQERGESVD
ncbi:MULTISPECIES: 3-dehydroquinate synthase [Bacillaceae]|uniref:3-dehydroquinate synthase n=1 Tax=Bacillaceae TaxID=186817 RepID=UPI000BFBB37A|nr:MULTISPECIES: 3-dehydroquinate synthase [Bacillaceae]PGT87458.1 3-dehydroquinate synthase [Bacillus sp. AFS040349]UGB29264.1 3-dehydroquinate synthase [Metabacillus sp. B2-18]